jgi:geranylgeranyl diphosphate synthase, type II
MSDLEKFEAELERRILEYCAPPCPPRLADAIRHAVLARGNRLRPRLLLAVARAAGARVEDSAFIAAIALELLHCASLIQDDLPCFDNSPLRRGAPSVHAAFDAALAILVSDALIVGAFDLLAEIGEDSLPIIRLYARATGAPRGIAAGQAWELEPEVSLDLYHRAKTAALFEAACMAGAIIAGDDPQRWQELGCTLGQAYQILDDLRDAGAGSSSLGKPTGRDAALGRPNAIKTMGLAGSARRFEEKRHLALNAVPSCSGHEELRRFLLELFQNFRRELPMVLSKTETEDWRRAP